MKKIPRYLSIAVMTAAFATAHGQSTSAPSTVPAPTTAATMAATAPSTMASPTTLSLRASTAPTSRRFASATSPSTERSTVAPLPRRSPTTTGGPGTPEALLAQRPPQDIPAAPPLAREFSILSRRSIFIKGQQSVGDINRNSGPRNFTPPTPEENLVFDGGTKNGDEIFAMLEDRSNGGRINVVKVGERVASGKLTAINLDAIDYEANGQTHHIGIGQNLQGTQINGPLASLPGSPGATTTPISTTGPTAITPGLSAEDIIERLRRRRALESSH